jgi:hypothetical protein
VRPQERIEDAIGTLCRYSFVLRIEGDNTGAVDGGEECYGLYRLVHLATKVSIARYGSTAAMVQQALAHIIFSTYDLANQAL